MTPQLPAVNIAEYIIRHPTESCIIFGGCITIGVALITVGVGGLITVKQVT